MAAIENEKTFTIAEISEEIGINAKTIRKVLRNRIEKEKQPGRGARWVIKESHIPALRSMIDAHQSKVASVADLSDFLPAD